jgi:hypothetical protein
MANPYAPPSVDEHPALGEPHDYRSTHVLSLVLRVLLGACASLLVVGLGLGVLRLDLFERVQRGSGFTIAEAEASDMQVTLHAALYMLVVLTTAITWIVWQTRTSKNARALGTEDMEFGPHAWGWFFCPILNLFRPLAVVQELWRVNDPRSSAAPPSYFSLWWVAWVIGTVGGKASARFVSEDAEIDELIVGLQLDIATNAFLLVAAILAIKVVAEVHRREQARARSPR